MKDVRVFTTNMDVTPYTTSRDINRSATIVVMDMMTIISMTMARVLNRSLVYTMNSMSTYASLVAPRIPYEINFHYISLS